MASEKIERLIDELMNWPYDALIDFNQFGLTYEEKQELYEAIEERNRNLKDWPETAVM